MKTFLLRLSIACLSTCLFAACAADDGPKVTKKKKKRPLLPGEEVSDLSWNRPVRANDVATPLGMPMSR